LPSEYTYIEKGLIVLAKLSTDNDLKHIALPGLGCGNGGLDWVTVKEMIYKHLNDLDTLIEVYPPDN